MNLPSESRNGTEKCDKSNDNKTLPPLLSEANMDKILSGYKSDAEPMSMEVLEVIRDGIQSHPSINRR